MSPFLDVVRAIVDHHVPCDPFAAEGVLRRKGKPAPQTLPRHRRSPRAARVDARTRQKRCPTPVYGRPGARHALPVTSTYAGGEWQWRDYILVGSAPPWRPGRAARGSELARSGRPLALSLKCPSPRRSRVRASLRSWAGVGVSRAIGRRATAGLDLRARRGLGDLLPSIS